MAANAPALPNRSHLKRDVNKASLDNVSEDDKAEFIAAITDELDPSGPTFKARNKPPVQIFAKLNEFDASDIHKAAIQGLGAKTGCHTCGTKIAIATDQNWVADHQPPVKLKKHIRKLLVVDYPSYYLFPQCDLCAAQQASVVARLNSGELKTSGLDAHQKSLVCGGLKIARTAKFGISCTNDKPTSNQRAAIQDMGAINGCHSCVNKIDATHPNKIYHADHIYPQEMMTNYMKELFTLLGIANLYPTQQEFRPQCKSCSNKQGARWNQIAEDAARISNTAGVKRYKQTISNEKH